MSPWWSLALCQAHVGERCAIPSCGSARADEDRWGSRTRRGQLLKVTASCVFETLWFAKHHEQNSSGLGKTRVGDLAAVHFSFYLFYDLPVEQASIEVAMPAWEPTLRRASTRGSVVCPGVRSGGVRANSGPWRRAARRARPELRRDQSRPALAGRRSTGARAAGPKPVLLAGARHPCLKCKRPGSPNVRWHSRRSWKKESAWHPL